MKYTLLIFGLLWVLGASGQIYIDSYRFGAAPSATLLLDDYPNAAAAYSLRKLRTAYTGNCIVVRRASTGDTLAIGFSGNYLDTAALKTFCSGTNCFVQRWYDQSGNAQDGTQSSTSAQPSIVTSGVINRSAVTNYVGLQGAGTTYLTVVNSKTYFDFLHDGTLNSFIHVAQFGTSSNPNISSGIMGTNAGTGANRGMFYAYDDRSSVSRNNAFSIAFSRLGAFVASILENNAMLPNKTTMSFVNVDLNNATLANRIMGYIDNGAVIATNTQNAIAQTGDATFDLQIGTLGNNVAPFHGFYYELVLWDSSQSANRTGIQSNINSFYNIY